MCTLPESFLEAVSLMRTTSRGRRHRTSGKCIRSMVNIHNKSCPCAAARRIHTCSLKCYPKGIQGECNGYPKGIQLAFKENTRCNQGKSKVYPNGIQWVSKGNTMGIQREYNGYPKGIQWVSKGNIKGIQGISERNTRCTRGEYKRYPRLSNKHNITQSYPTNNPCC